MPTDRGKGRIYRELWTVSGIEITDEMRSAVLNARGADDGGTFMPLAEMLRHCGESKSRLVADAIISAVAPLIAAQERDACAQIADLYADENIRMCGDSIINDPMLAKARHGRLRHEGLTHDESALSDQCQTDGTIHSSMHHAARHIAAAILARGKNG